MFVAFYFQIKIKPNLYNDIFFYIVYIFSSAQIHVLEDGKIHIYSRNSEDNTSKYPDIIARMPHAITDKVKSCVIDSEAVAWDAHNKQILPFQVLSTRKRKVSGY